jgi:hypothetical protein
LSFPQRLDLSPQRELVPDGKFISGRLQVVAVKGVNQFKQPNIVLDLIAEQHTCRNLPAWVRVKTLMGLQSSGLFFPPSH